MTRLAGRTLAACLIVGGVSCGQSGPTDSDRTVRLSLAIWAPVNFAVRIWVDGETIYSQSAPTTQSHVAEVVQAYRRGVHVVEYEILAADSNPALYTAGWTVEVRPGNVLLAADGPPTLLSVGERLTIRVSV